jgi:hypothetical protein
MKKKTDAEICGEKLLPQVRDTLIKITAMQTEVDKQLKQIPKNISKNERIMRNSRVMSAFGSAAKVRHLIKKIGNPVWEKALAMRYVDFMKWGEIARKLKYSESRLYEINRIFLDKISGKLQGTHRRKRDV